MSLDEMAEKYSKKWNVPVEEAKKQIKKFLEQKPVDRTRVTPSTENIFPEPLGPLSKKIQDINQAALATAYTHKSLREMSLPPKEFESLRDKVEGMEKAMDQVVSLVNTTMKEWKDTLEAKKAEEERQKLVEEINEKVIQPLKEKVEALEAVKGGNKDAMRKLSPEEIFETGKKLTSEAEEWLERFGYKVEMPKALTMEQVEAKLKERVGQAKEKWEKESGAQVEIETQRIKATENILSNLTDRIIDIFLEPVKQKIQEAIEKGAFRRPPSGA